MFCAKEKNLIEKKIKIHVMIKSKPGIFFYPSFHLGLIMDLGMSLGFGERDVS